VQLLNREINALVLVPAARERLLKYGEIATKSVPAFRAQIRTEVQQYGDIVKRLNIKLE
jgi:hypothetical protein